MKVPGSAQPEQPRPPPVSETELAMAAAIMYDLGRFKPKEDQSVERK